MASCRPPGDLGDRLDDVGIRAAAADIAAHTFAYLGRGRLRLRRKVARDVAWHSGLDLAKDADGGADLARRAITALVAVVFHESGLHGMQIVGTAEAFDRGDRVALVHHRERQAGGDAAAIDE